MTDHRPEGRGSLVDKLVALCEAKRVAILNDPNNPSWTEPFAELQNEIRALMATAAPPAHQSMREALELCGGLKQPHECSRYHEWVSLVDKGQCNKTFTHWNLDAALSAPPVEPQGVRACLMEGVVLVSKTMLLPNTRDIHAWADKAKAALAACAPKGECGK